MSGETWTTRDLPDQSGRVAVVTGANSGLGLETARELAKAGASVVLAVRSLDRGKAAIDEIRAGQPAPNSTSKSWTWPRSTRSALRRENSDPTSTGSTC